MSMMKYVDFLFVSVGLSKNDHLYSMKAEVLARLPLSTYVFVVVLFTAQHVCIRGGIVYCSALYIRFSSHFQVHYSVLNCRLLSGECLWRPS